MLLNRYCTHFYCHFCVIKWFSASILPNHTHIQHIESNSCTHIHMNFDYICEPLSVCCVMWHVEMHFQCNKKWSFLHLGFLRNSWYCCYSAKNKSFKFISKRHILMQLNHVNQQYSEMWWLCACACMPTCALLYSFKLHIYPPVPHSFSLQKQILDRFFSYYRYYSAYQL